jgi:phosphopantetheine--protein transferase-like protein
MISKEPVGIDIEQVKEKVERIAHKFMRKEELAFISDEHKIPQLYVCWCVKEAVYKCFGQKEVSFLDNILLDPFNFEGHGLVKTHLRKDETCLDYEVNYMQYHDYMVGYAKG